MTYFIIMILLALAGIGETTYLIARRRKNQKPVCTGPGKCNGVLESKYNKTFGVHNDVLGLAFYGFTFGVHSITLLGVLVGGPSIASDEPLELLHLIFLIGLIVALIMSTRFVYIMAFILKKWCPWCVASAITTVLMSITVLLSILL